MDRPVRFSASSPCPICGGWEHRPRGRGERCFGYSSGDGKYAYCTRAELAGPLPESGTSSAYRHYMAGPCRCGLDHRSGPSTWSVVHTEPRTRHRRAPAGTFGRTVATYDYTDTLGKLIFQAVRLDPKGFTQRRPDGHGGWVYSLNGIPRPLPLYGMPELRITPPNVEICVVEGEKDVHALRRLGLVATTCAMGAGKARHSDWGALAGRHVALLPDNDEVGAAHMADVEDCLQGVAASVRWVTLPNLPPKGDVSDWLAAGGTAEELHALLTPPMELVPGSILETFPEPPTRPRLPMMRGIDRLFARRLHRGRGQYAPHETGYASI